MPTDYTIKPGSWLSDEEYCTFLKHWSTLGHDPYWRDRFELCSLLALGAGLRVSEMVEIYVEPAAGKSYCQVVDGPEGPQARLYLFGTKGKGGGKKGRIAPERHRLAQVIPELVPQFQRRYERRVQEGHALLFSRPDGTPYRVLTFQTWWMDVMRLCEIDRGMIQGRDGRLRHDRPSIHEGRHTFATWEVAARRLNAEEVAAQIGNDPTTTRTTYQHAILETLFLENKTPQWRTLAASVFTERKLRVAG